MVLRRMIRSLSVLAVTTLLLACGDKSPVCAEEVDDEAAADVLIRIHNPEDTDVFLLSDCDLRLWRIHRPNSMSLFPPDRCSPPSCEAPPDDDCRQSCPLNCIGVPPVRIVPGGVFEVRWPQLVHDFIDRETECGICGCLKTVRAVAGDDLVVALTVSRDVSTCEPNACNCMPDAQGSCVVTGEGLGPSVELALPVVFSGNTIELDVGPL